MNLSGLVVVALGIFIFIVAIRGTQANVFPFFFSDTIGTRPPPITDPSKPVLPDQNGNYPSGMIKIYGTCHPAGFHGGV